MITVYGLTYHSLRFFKESINSLLDSASEEVNFIIADNLSPESGKIRAYGKQLVQEGKIKKFIGFDNNCMIRAFNFLFEAYPPEGDFFIFTELDVVVPERVDWVAETKGMQLKSAITGYPLALDNYVLPNTGHQDDYPLFGFWLMGLNTKKFTMEYDRVCRTNKVPLSDNLVRGLMSRYGCQRSPNRLKHLGWDIWKEPGLEQYWEAKKSGVKWERAPHPIIGVKYE